jgi:hypothetical protein
MERVETLCNRLQEQLSKKASVDELMLTVQMLQSELMHLKSQELPGSVASAVSIQMPASFEPAAPEVPLVEEPEERTVVVLEIDEAEVEAELEEIKKNAEARNKIGASNKPPMLFDPVEDTPTLIHQQPTNFKPQKEVHESIASDDGGSLNDKLKQTKTELSDALQELPVKDLKKAIGINDRFLYINELFRGDEVMYERSIKTINGFSIYPEAEYWIKRELKLKLGWDDRAPIVQQFDQLVRRRFSVT